MSQMPPGLDWFGYKLDYPMFIVTAAADGERSGCLVGFAAQCSIDPLRFAVFVSKNNHTYRVVVRATALAVQVVPSDAMELAELFGGETGDEIDKFDRCAWRTGPLGSPLLDRCPNWCEGTIVSSFDAGDHECFMIEPDHGHATEEVTALTFDRAKAIDPGHEA